MRVWILLATLVLPISAWAVDADNRLLDRANIKRQAASVEIHISFTRTLRYVTHTPSDSGDYIKIQLSPLSRASSDDQGQEGRSTIRWRPTAEVPLDEISIETDQDTDPFLIVRFTQPVKFTVRPGKQLNSIVITLPAAKTGAPEAKKEVPLPRGTGKYVLNLQSRQEQYGDNLPVHPLFKGKRLYVSKAMYKGSATYRLRLGFFDSFEQAKSFKEKLDKDFPGIWLSQVTDAELQAATKKVVKKKEVDLSEIKVKPKDKERPLPAVNVQRLDELMEQARRAVAEGNNTRAIAIYEKVIQYPVQPYQRDAMEFLGLARERKGQLAQAKAVYETYLQKYPEGEASERVRQRLAGLVTASVRKREKLRATRREEEGEPWEFFGSLSQSYRRDISTTDSAGSEVTQSSLATDLDFNARKRTEKYDLRARATGGYTYDFLEEADHSSRFSSLYIDLTTNDGIHGGRVGRQSRTTGGVLGRFDGAYYGYQFSDWGKLNLVSGGLVESTEDGLLKSDRFFNGVSVDISQVLENWDFNLFFIDQRVDGDIDRQAVGAEVRYFEEGNSLFGLLDYDISYNEVNIAYILANLAVSDATTLNLILDYRKSPILTTSNALQGQSVTSIKSLKNSFSKGVIRALAEDRTATSKSATLGVSHQFHPQWQLSSDVTVSNLSGTPASGGVPANPSTGDEYFWNLQLIGSNIFREGDLIIPSLRYSDTSTANTISTALNARFPVGSKWRVNPRMRLDYRERNNGTDQWVLAPSVRATYRVKKNVSIELEGGGEWSEEHLSSEVDRSSLLFFYLGYRWNF